MIGLVHFLLSSIVATIGMEIIDIKSKERTLHRPFWAKTL